MGISHYIKEIGRGARGAKALDRAQAADLFGQVLDGQVTDLEIGAFCLAMRIKGETAEEMSGLLDAVHARMAAIPACADGQPLIVLPSYNGARKLPGLARLLAVREVIGLRTPGHSVAKLMNPCAGPALVVSSFTHPEYFDILSGTFATLGAHALLSRGLEGEVAADPRRTPRYDAFIGGTHQLLQDQQPGTAAEVPGLPTEIDVATTAAYTRRVLAGDAPVPPALRQQVEHILHLSRQITAQASS